MTNVPRIASIECRTDNVCRDVSALETRVDRIRQTQTIDKDEHTEPTESPTLTVHAVASHRGQGTVAPAPSAAASARSGFSAFLEARTSPPGSVTLGADTAEHTTAGLAEGALMWLDDHPPETYDIHTPHPLLASLETKVAALRARLDDHLKDATLVTAKLDVTFDMTTHMPKTIDPRVVQMDGWQETLENRSLLRLHHRKNFRALLHPQSSQRRLPTATGWTWRQRARSASRIKPYLGRRAKR